MSAAKTRATPKAKAAGARREPARAGKAGSLTPRLVEELVERAKAVRERAYAPYSKYKVGAAILTKSGMIFTGCNVENASYGGAICAERSAIVQMVAAGEREPIACVVVTAGKRAGSPCGFCRQVLAEFAEDMPVVMVGLTPRGETRKRTTLTRLLPDAFTPASLG